MKRIVILLMVKITICYLFPGNLQAQSLGFPLSVVDLLKMAPRQIEMLDTFYVAGQVGSSKNFAFWNYYSLCDRKFDEAYVLITSEKKALPNPGELLQLKVTLFTEFRWNKENLIVLKELK